MVDTATTQPPDRCPACGASPNSRYDARRYTTFECGLTLNNETGKYLIGHNCTRAFAAAVTLRQKLADEKTANECLQDELTALRVERDAALAQVENWRKRIEAHIDYTEPKIDRVKENVAALTARVAELQAAGQESLVPIAALILETGTHKYLHTSLIWQFKKAHDLLLAALSPAREGKTK